MPLLPFLKNKRKETGVIVQERASDAPESDDGSSAIEACAQDILRAISDNDSKHLALAIKAAFDICESYPHEEAEHIEEGTE